MSIAQMTVCDALNTLRENHRLPLRESASLTDQTLVAAVLRRIAEIACPCSPATLASRATALLLPLASDASALKATIEDTVDAVIMAGDLIELGHVSNPSIDASANFLYAAPPSFVELRSRRCYILGVAPDDVSPLPSSLSERVQYVRALRFVDPTPEEALGKTLESLGLRKLEEAFWLHSPKVEPAERLMETLRARLGTRPSNGDMSNLVILASGTGGMAYRQRWREPDHESGMFVARRPQTYGADLWCLVQLKNGSVTHCLEFPFPDSRLRGCDIAWRAQLAFDAAMGSPMQAAVSASKGGRTVKLSFPIPMWAQRYLSIIGAESLREFNPFEFWVPDAEYGSVKAYLQERLWLSVVD